MQSIRLVQQREASRADSLANILPVLALSNPLTTATASNLHSTNIPIQGECAVLGVGVLGTSLCRKLLMHPSMQQRNIVGITRSKNRHALIRDEVSNKNSCVDDSSDSDRFHLATMEEIKYNLSLKNQKFRDVIFCAPPSGFDDYAHAVADAATSLWAGREGGGVFVFTSSGGVYGPGEVDTNVVNEFSPTADPESSPRVSRLVNAEKNCRDIGGCCLRLAGLYNLDRGAHNFWLTSGKPVLGSPDGIINLLHYDDAAGACVAAMVAGPSICDGTNFLISDGNPLTRMQICQSALQARMYSNQSLPEFVNQNQPGMLALGKVYDGSYSNQQLKWKPSIASFDEFMKSHA
jgi:nucleoside-diphosphate-sugar epimerase